MKYPVLCVMLFHPFFLLARSAPPIGDSLKKYSYNISGTYRNPADSLNITNYTATGFFIHRESKIIFITAGHVLTGCKESMMGKRNYPDEMTIFLNDDNGHFTGERIKVNIKQLRDTGSCPAIKYPDIAGYEILDSLQRNIYFIDSLVGKDSSKITGFIKIFGFPISRNIERVGYELKESSNLSIENYQLLDSFNFINSNVELEVDSTNYILKPRGIAVDATLKGYSGAPVFEFSGNSWRFMGLLVGANLYKKYLVIVKSRFLREILIN